MGMTSRGFALLGRAEIVYRDHRDIGNSVIVQDRRHCLLTYIRARNKASQQSVADRVNASTSYSYYYSCKEFMCVCSGTDDRRPGPRN
jgi:hypothetical protein